MQRRPLLGAMALGSLLPAFARAQAPAYPVIWGNIYPDSKYPFGNVVDIPKQAAA